MSQAGLAFNRHYAAMLSAAPAPVDDRLNSALVKLKSWVELIQQGKRGESFVGRPVVDCINDLPAIIRELEAAELEIEAAFERYDDALATREEAPAEAGEKPLYDRSGGYLNDPEGLARMRERLLATDNWHDAAPINCNSLARLLDTIEALRAKPPAREDAQPDTDCVSLLADLDAGKPVGREAAATIRSLIADRSAPDALREEVERLRAALNTPEVDDFAKAVVLEAQHQRERWPSEHDAGKAPLDWFWLVGYLAQKAATAQMAGDDYKAKHHTISTAAALANWHAAISGEHTAMRPGIEPPATEALAALPAEQKGGA